MSYIPSPREWFGKEDYEDHVPVLRRQPSINVSDQKAGDCWNYSSCRIVTRLICNVLNIEPPTDNECNELYTHINEFHYTIAKETCEPGAYEKLLLYFFLFCLGYSKFTCAINKETQQNEQSINGQSSERVLEFFTDNLLNNRDFRNNEFVKNIGESGLVSYSTNPDEDTTQKEFERVIYPLIDNFHRVTKKQKVKYSVNKIDMNTPGILDTIKELLNHGLYIGIGISIGDGKYSDKFTEYKADGRPRPIAKHIDMKGDLGGHAMHVIDYSNIENKPDILQLTIRNSWGNDWGNNGKINMLSSELKQLTARFSYIRPSNLNILQQKADNHPIVPEDKNTEDIYEFDELYEIKKEKVLELLRRFGDINKKKFHDLYEILVGDNLYDDEINEVFNEINHNDSNILDPYELSSMLVANYMTTIKFKEFKKKIADLMKDINEDIDNKHTIDTLYYGKNGPIDMKKFRDLYYKLVTQEFEGETIHVDLFDIEIEEIFKEVNNNDEKILDVSKFKAMVDSKPKTSIKISKLVEVINKMLQKVSQPSDHLHEYNQKVEDLVNKINIPHKGGRASRKKRNVKKFTKKNKHKKNKSTKQ